jgi:hypothetical protein
MYGSSMHENREIPWVPAGEGPAGRVMQGTPRTITMYAHGKSDMPIVPMKPANKADRAVGRRSRWREGA